MDLGLQNKIALVTGGSRGIGKAIAAGLLAEGCRVAITARGKETLEQTIAELSPAGEIVGIPADMTVDDEIGSAFDQVIRRFGGLDILVNNVGGSGGAGFLGTDDASWRYAIDVNLMAAVRTSRRALPEMRKRGGGRIITISSIYGRESGGLVTYNAVKAAEISVMKSLAREFARDNILVNSVCPGSILFPGGLWQRRIDANPEAMADFVRRDMPLGRWGRPEEVANVVVFLVSERASLVSGAAINVDGCQSRSNI